VREGKKWRFSSGIFLFEIGLRESPLLPLPEPNKMCHSELIHHANTFIINAVEWINEESSGESEIIL
jgi:hypothetical protein